MNYKNWKEVHPSAGDVLPAGIIVFKFRSDDYVREIIDNLDPFRDLMYARPYRCTPSAINKYRFFVETKVPQSFPKSVHAKPLPLP